LVSRTIERRATKHYLGRVFATSTKDGRALSLLRKLDDRVEVLSPQILVDLVEALVLEGDLLLPDEHQLPGMLSAATVAARLVCRVLPFLVPLQQPCELLETNLAKTESLLFAMTLFPLRSALAGEAQQPVTAEEETFLADLVARRVAKDCSKASKLIESYTAEYRAKTLADEKAKTLADEMVAIDMADGGLQSSYVPKLSKVLPSRKVARYLQIENKIRAVVKYELAAEIPLVP